MRFFCVRYKKEMEGLAPIDTLRGDRWTWRENTHEIIGERTGRRFRAGDRVQVILDRILAQERKLQFSIVEEDLPLSGKTAANSPPQGKEERPRLAGAIVQREKKARQEGQAALRFVGPQRHLQRIIAG
ncbi:MAG TPA: hypothetical protein VKG86_04230 [Terracidiphilus sp.]|nr:hypothetical protein [Terracidiphilus sp.]